MENNQPQTQTQQSLVKQGTQVVLVQGQLRKIIHQEGEGQCPKKGQQIFALYRGTLQNGQQFDSNQDRDSPFTFTLGQGRVIKGWDEGFASMKKGQKATLVCSPDYAYGKRGSPPRIPPNSTLNFQVQLLDFKDKKKEKWELSQQQKFTQATNKKNEGNEAFKKANYKQAAQIYREGLDYVDSQQSQKLQQIQKVLRLNVAQAQLKIGQNSQAIKNCTKVLDRDANNLKALYRRGLAYLKNQYFKNAETDFSSLLKIEPGNVEAQKQLQNVKLAQKAARQKQKRVFGNMFSKAGTYSQQTKKQQTPVSNQNQTNGAVPTEGQAQKKEQ